MDPTLFPSGTRPYQSSGTITAATYAVGLLALIMPIGRMRVVLSLAALFWLLLQTRLHSTGSIPDDYINTIGVLCFLLRWITFVVFGTPERDCHRTRGQSIREAPHEGHRTLWEKLEWSFGLLTTVRGVGWNWQVKNIEEVPEAISRQKFVIQQLLCFARAYIGLDFVAHFLRASPFGKAADIFALPMHQQLWIAWLLAFRAGYELAMPYYLFAGIAVGLRISRPQNWPPVFGTFREAHTLRKVWGRCWHQFLRRIFETWTNVGIRILDLKQGSFMSRYAKLYGSFLISALIHHAGSLNNPYTPGVRHQFLFFMLQPLAISFEDAAIYIGKKLGIERSWKVQSIGYLWVFVWLSFSLRYGVKQTVDWQIPIEPNPLVFWSIADRILV